MLIETATAVRSTPPSPAPAKGSAPAGDFQAALAAATAMEKAGLTMPGIAEISAEKVNIGVELAVSGDIRGLSAVLWSFFWFTDEGAVCNMFIDDSTGKMVGVVMSTPRFKDREHLYIQMENWRVFLEDYYGTDVQITGEEWFDTSVRFALTFPLGGDGEKSYFQLDLYLHFLDGFATLSPYISPFGGAAAESPPPYDSSYDS